MKANQILKTSCLGGLLVALLLSGSLNSQSVAVTETTPVAKAILEASSTTQGLLLPRMDEGQKLTLSAAPPSGTPLTEGMMIYQTDGAEGYYYWSGTTWVPFTTHGHGAVEMVVGSSNVVLGTGFTVSHISEGLDEITFANPKQDVPIVILSGSTIVGVPPVFPNDYCDIVFGDCLNTYLAYIDLVVGGQDQFKTGNTNCNPVPGKSTKYLLSDPEWQDWPSVGSGAIPFAPGSTFDVRYRTTIGSPGYVSAWADWDHSGSFEIGELLWQENGTVNTNLERIETVNVPGGACLGKTAIRLVVRDTPNHDFSCDLGDPNALGETETIEIVVGASLNPPASCVYPERQTICNVSATNISKFNVQCTDISGQPTNALYYFKVLEAN